MTNYTYTQNDVLIEIDPAPAGENPKKRQLEYDGLGRLKSVCEVASGGTAGNCGQTAAQIGLFTKYTYDALDNLKTVNQNAQTASPQTRTYTWDGLGRLVSEKNPETAGNGNSYTYDSDATCGTSKGDLVKRADPAGNVTCYAYDALHRVTAITYPSGPYAATTPTKTFVYDGATVNGAAMANAKGRLAEAYTGSSSNKITDLGFSYSVRGEVTDTYKSTPHSGGYYHVSASYWENGLRKTLSTNLSGPPTSWTYTPDGEGRINAVSATSGQNPLTSTTYNGFGLVSGLTFGSGDSDAFVYGPTGLMTQYKFTVNGSSVTGNLTWNANGTLQQLGITDALNASNNQTCAYIYGDVTRLYSANCGAVFSQTYSNDAFGNVKKSGTISFQPTYDLATNRFSTLPAGTPSYDANGNVLSDGFHSYTWDAEGKLTQLDTTATLIYDALGRWAEKFSNGGYVQNVYGPDGGEFALNLGQTFAAVRLRLPGGAVAHYANPIFGGNPLVYRHPDWLETTRLYSTDAHVVVTDNAFAPYGEQYVGQGADNFFTGVAPTDIATDVREFPAREYHSTQGRWLTPDPAGLAAVDLANPQTLNRYAYALDNPLSNVDPSGMSIVPCEDPNSIACVGNDPQPPSAPGYPGCVAYGTEGCIRPPCVTLGASCTPVNPGGSPNIGGGAVSPQSPSKTGTRPDWLNKITSIFGYDQNDSRKSCFGSFVSDSLDGMNPFSPSPQAPTPGEIITATYASYKYNQAIRYAATTASRTFGTSFLVYPNKSSTFRSILNSAQKVGAKESLLGSADVAMFQALISEVQSIRNGECQ